MNTTINIKIHLLFGVLSTLLLSCDKIDNAYPSPETELDITLYPGNWSDYITNFYPDFQPNNYTLQNVLIEDYTGHTCNNCPNAAITAYSIQENNPDRVFVVAIHAGPTQGGISPFQQFYPDNDMFFTNHTSPEGLTYGDYFRNGYNFYGNPQGTVNRKTVDDKLFDVQGTWSSRTSSELSSSPAPVKMQAVFNYFASTGGGYLHVEVEKNTNEAIPINTMVYVIKNSEMNWQVMPDNSYNEFYEHKNKHIGNMDQRAWGRTALGTNASQGEKIILDYDYKIPEDISIDNMHFIIYTFNPDTHEIYQVIKQSVVE